MIIYRPNESLFDANTQVITNTVNCVGVMGKGIALEFKKRFPGMFEDYKARCKSKDVKPGIPYLWESDELDCSILNFPTKDHWRGKSKIEWVDSGLSWLKENYLKIGIESIAIPPLGCGNGGLYWTDVKKVLENHFGDVEDFLVSVYLPSQSTKGTNGKKQGHGSIKKPKTMVAKEAANA